MENPIRHHLLTVSEVARLLRTDRSFVYRELQRTRQGIPGAIPAFRVGVGPRASWRFSRDAVLVWLRDKQD